MKGGPNRNLRRTRSASVACVVVTTGLALSSDAAPDGTLGITATANLSAAGRQQDLLVSRGVGGINSDQSTAMNPNNGDVLVVWNHKDDGFGTSPEVWSALLRRKGSGKYKKPRPRRLFAGTTRSPLTPRAAWIEANQEFLVVWQRTVKPSN